MMPTTNSDRTTDASARSPRNNPAAKWVLVTSILASGMAFIDGTALSVAFPALQADLGATGANLLWVTNGFSLPLAALLLFGGALGDAFGRKRIFIVGIVVFVAASTACGLAPTIPALVAMRVIQGIGGALMIPGSLAMISNYFPPETRGRAIGTWSAFSVVATTLGPIVGGLLAGAGYWRGVFWINLPLAAVALVVLATKIPADPANDRRVHIDGWGAATIAVGLAALNYGLIRCGQFGIGDATLKASLLMGVVSIAAFFSIESRVAQPLLPLQIFKSRTLCGASLLSFLFYVAFHGVLFFLPLNLIQIQGYAPSQAGLTQVPIMVLLVLLSTWAGKLVDRHGPRVPLVIGPIVAGLGFLALAFPGVTAGPAEFWKTYLPGLLLVGVGLGFTATPVSTTVMISTPSQRLGLASGINSSLTRLAGVFAISALGPVMLVLFSRSLATRASELGLTDHVMAQLQAEAPKLAVAQVPAGLDAAVTHAVRSAIQWAFVDAFRWTVGIAAVLCWLGALAAARLFPRRERTLPRPARPDLS